MSVHHQTTRAAFLDAAQVLRGPLPEVVSMEPILEGVPFAHEKTVFDGADGFFAVWACGAGVFPRVKDKRGSFMYILSGDATIVDEDGTSHELTADSVLVLPFGWVGTWHIRETIRKVYLHTTPAPPLPGTVVASAFRPADRVLAEMPPGPAAAPGSPADTDTRDLRRSRRPLRHQVAPARPVPVGSRRTRVLRLRPGRRRLHRRPRRHPARGHARWRHRAPGRLVRHMGHPPLLPRVLRAQHPGAAGLTRYPPLTATPDKLI